MTTRDCSGHSETYSCIATPEQRAAAGCDAAQCMRHPNYPCQYILHQPLCDALPVQQVVYRPRWPIAVLAMLAAALLAIFALAADAQEPTYSVRVGWRAPTLDALGFALTNLQGFVCYRWETLGPTETQRFASATATQAVFSTLRYGIEYGWAVAAFNPFGTSENSRVVWTNRPPPAAVPAAPEGPTLEVIEDAPGLRVRLYQEHKDGGKAEHWLEKAATAIQNRKAGKAKRNIKNAIDQKARLEVLEAQR